MELDMRESKRVGETSLYFAMRGTIVSFSDLDNVNDADGHPHLFDSAYMDEDEKERGNQQRREMSCCTAAELWKLVVFLWVVWPPCPQRKKAYGGDSGTCWCQILVVLMCPQKGFLALENAVWPRHRISPSDQQSCAGDFPICAQNKLEDTAKARIWKFENFIGEKNCFWWVFHELSQLPHKM